eukprot:CAMPEP_0115145130 /NCGR_PEP_ID=MMETSP0227-20121206/61936_1 /TAXON_ID=89957 /ORGANISM="Polarella glacialis, Strain CCMP 1383" /LENGTH=220 /DNA_ID=CAMNT_0002554597 /DNA_START=87 /DNA_END=746 /DNA_ORIENTATION=+
MAAVVAILVSLRRSLKARPAGGGSSDGCGIDENEDGYLSIQEVKDHMPQLAIRGDLLQERLKMEREMRMMLCKLPVFLLGLVSFLLAINTFFPSAEVAEIHSHILNHFKVEDIFSITELGGIYDFVEGFGENNMELQATGYRYWCDVRYLDHKWDDELEVPHWECPSPRAAALGYGPSWSSLNPPAELSKTLVAVVSGACCASRVGSEGQRTPTTTATTT